MATGTGGKVDDGGGLLVFLLPSLLKTDSNSESKSSCAEVCATRSTTTVAAIDSRNIMLAVYKLFSIILWENRTIGYVRKNVACRTKNVM